MPLHLHQEHELHDFDNIGAPASDGVYYLQVTKTGSNYTYEYVKLVLTGTAAPSVAPDFIGQKFIDTTNKHVYIAIGTTDSGDWENMNA